MKIFIEIKNKIKFEYYFSNYLLFTFIVISEINYKYLIKLILSFFFYEKKINLGS